MKCIILSFGVLVVCANELQITTPHIEDPESFHEDGVPGSPLFLTPYIESGNIEVARKISRVDFPGLPDIESYAGFFTVDKVYDSNQFLWYFPANNYIKEPSVVLWLQGGPGSSSLYGLFNENGPIEFKNGAFHKRETHWAQDHHLIYIDNPVGVGFSFTNDTRGYCTDQTRVGEHLYTTLIQFFQMFPELQKYEFFVSGESYAGKYVPALGYTIHKKNPSAKITINLKGLIIGNGLCDPINQLGYGDYLYQIGLVDSNQKIEIEIYQNQVIEFIKREIWTNASTAYFNLLNYTQNTIGNISIYNYLNKDSTTDYEYCTLLESDAVRKAIHVGNLQLDCFNGSVHNSLNEDFPKSVAPLITELLDFYHILFYNGQLDIIVAYPLTVNFIRKLKFSGSEEYLKAERQIITTVDLLDNSTVVTGYMKSAGKLTEALVRNAGHMVPENHPEWILHLIKQWRNHIEDDL